MLLVSREDPVEESGLFDAAAGPPVLKSLLRISDAILRADYFEEVLEVIAEQALIALSAASLSISRWDTRRDALQTLINVGDLAPGEQRWPQDEVYYIADDPLVTQLLQHGRSYTNAVDDENCPPDCKRLLLDLGQSELAVPVMCGETMWGEICGGRRRSRVRRRRCAPAAGHLRAHRRGDRPLRTVEHRVGLRAAGSADRHRQPPCDRLVAHRVRLGERLTGGAGVRPR